MAYDFSCVKTSDCFLNSLFCRRIAPVALSDSAASLSCAFTAWSKVPAYIPASAFNFLYLSIIFEPAPALASSTVSPLNSARILRICSPIDCASLAILFMLPLLTSLSKSILLNLTVSGASSKIFCHLLCKASSSFCAFAAPSFVLKFMPYSNMF